MKSDNLKKCLKESLKESFDLIYKSIEKNNRNMEIIFSNSLLKLWEKQQIAYEKEFQLHSAGGKSFHPKNKRGRIDAVTIDQNKEPLAGFEFKVVRLPRLVANILYDVRQISSDFLRLRSSEKLTNAWVIAYVYGPLVDDATSSGDLFRRFQNSMFVDVSLISLKYPKGSGQYKYERLHQRKDAFDTMGWSSPKLCCSMDQNAFAVLVEGKKAKIGVVCFKVR